MENVRTVSQRPKMDGKSNRDSVPTTDKDLGWVFEEVTRDSNRDFDVTILFICDKDGSH